MYEELKEIKIQRITSGHPGTNPMPAPFITLDTLYNDGWWITEIFGSTAVIVHRALGGNSKRPHFRVLCKSITVDTITPKAMRTIKRIQREQWDKYKKYMLTEKKRNDRIYNK